MSSYLGVFFSKPESIYYNIRIQKRNQYLASQLFSPHYRIIDDGTFQGDFIQCSEKTVLNLRESDKISSHFTVLNSNIYFLFSDQFLFDENNMFIPLIYDEEELKKMFLKRFFHHYKLFYKEKSYLPSLDIKIKKAVILDKTKNYLKMSMLFDCWAKPHYIENKMYDLKTKESIYDFLEFELSIPRKILTAVDIEILDSF